MSIKLTWDVAVRKSGRQFTAAEINHYVLEMQVEGGPFAELPAPNATDVEYTLDVNDPGVYNFRLTCVPKEGSASDPVVASASISDLSAPVVAHFAASVV